jgi:hypothetical protein
VVGQRVDHRDADAVQTAGGLVGLARELAARVEVQRMTSSADLSGNFGCGSTGMPRPLSRTVTEPSSCRSTSMRSGVAGHRLVHGVVEHLGHQVVQRALIGAADIHAGAFADGLQPLQHLDGGGVIAALPCGKSIMTPPISDLDVLLRQLSPVLDPERYAYAASPRSQAPDVLSPIAVFDEEEGRSVIAPLKRLACGQSA